MARFEREVRATAQLSHWNTIEIFDYGRNDDGAFYYVMEYLPGLSLDILVHRHGPLPPARVIYLLRQACDALNEAHGVGTDPSRHQAGQPLRRVSGRAPRRDQVAGLRAGQDLAGRASIQLSQEDTIAGSPLYVAPEQVLHSQVPDRSHRHLFAGRGRLFPPDRPPPVPRRVRDGGHDRAHPRPGGPAVGDPAGIPADLEQVVLRCLAKQPGDRFPDTPSLGQALGRSAEAANWSPGHAADWWMTHQGAPAPSPSPESRGKTDNDPSGSGESVSDSAVRPVEVPRLS